MNVRALALVGLATVGFIGFVLWITPPPSNEGSSTKTVRSAPASGILRGGADENRQHLELASDGKSAAEDFPSEPGLPDRRREPVRAAYSLVVTTELGEPVLGALATWSPIPEYAPTSWQEALKAARAEAREARSDSEGRIMFLEAPSGSGGRGSVVWVTHTAHEPLSIRLESGGPWAVGRDTYVLESRAAIRARVTTSAGDPIGGAEVVQWGRDASKPAGVDPDLLRLLVRSAITDADGIAPMVAMPGEQYVVATAEEGISTPWIGVAESELELTIAATFELLGTVRRGPRVAPDVRLSIDVFGEAGHRRAELESLEDVKDRWGPVSLPVLPDRDYVIRLDGPGVVPFETVVRTPIPGESRALELEANFGETLWLIAINEAGEVLLDAESETEWVRDGRTTTTVFPARDDGFMFVEGLPPGFVRPTIRCEGYSTIRPEPILVPEENPVTHEFTLTTAGRIHGKVIADGQPVPDFQLSVWDAGFPHYRVEYTFTDREDGTFELKDVGIGRIVVHGASFGLGSSLPSPVELNANEPQALVLELATGIAAIGRAVDRATQEPLSGASVQAWAAGGGRLLRSLGPADTTGPDGSFRVHGLPRGEVAVVVTADGYGTEQVFFTPLEGERTDVGVLSLAKRQDLEVILLHGARIDPSQWACAIAGVESAGLRPFDADGRVVFEEVSAGSYQVQLREPSGHDRWKQIDLYSGTEWLASFDALRSGELRVELRMPDEEPVASGTTIMVSSRQRSGRVAYVDAEGVATFVGLASGSYRVEAFPPPSEDHVAIASRTLELRDEEFRTLVLTAGTPWPVLRILDQERAPVVGAILQVAVPGDTGLWAQDVQTGADGLYELSGLDAEEIVLALRHAELGERQGIRVDLRLSSDPIDVVLDAPVTQRFQLRDRTGPVVGVEGRLVPPLGYTILTSSFSDESGMATFSKIGAGEYTFRVDRIEYFPSAVPVTVAAGAPPIEVLLYRACDLQVVTTSGGLPRPHIEVELIHSDTATSLQAYLERKDVWSSTESLRTGDDGKFEMLLVPEGELEWRVSTPEGTTEGRLFVSPENTNTLRIEVP